MQSLSKIKSGNCEHCEGKEERLKYYYSCHWRWGQ